MKLLILLNLLFFSRIGFSSGFSQNFSSDFSCSCSASFDSSFSETGNQSKRTLSYDDLSLDELENLFEKYGKSARRYFEKGRHLKSSINLNKAKKLLEYINLNFPTHAALQENNTLDYEADTEDNARYDRVALVESPNDDQKIASDKQNAPDVDFDNFCDSINESLGETRSFLLSRAFSSVIARKIFNSNWGDCQGSCSIDTIDGISIRADYIPPASEKHGVVVLFPSNELTGKNWENTEVFRFFRKVGLGIVTPGIRPSTMKGNFNRSLLFDTEAVINFLINKHKISPDKILAFGYSLGSTYATNLASYFRTPLLLQNGCVKSEDIIKQWGKFTCKAILNEFRNQDYVPFYEESKLSYYDKHNLRTYAKFGYEFSNLNQDFGDNISKLSREKDKKSPIDVMILYSSKSDYCGGCENAQDLFNARYGFISSDNNRLSLEEESDPKQFLSSSRVKWKVLTFLLDNELVPRPDIYESN
ncbi:MAG: alpha/beta hydrolase family protein [Oligoflexales bacterium]